MAAGLSLAEDALERFALAFAAAVAEQVGEADLSPQLWSDGSLLDCDLSLETALELERLGPWGQAFAEPQFDDAFEILERRVVGGKHLKLLVQRADSPAHEAMLFQQGNRLEDLGEQAHLVYGLEVNRFRGRSKLTLMVRHWQPA